MSDAVTARLALALALAFAVACGDSTTPGHPDAQADARADAQADAGFDSGPPPPVSTRYPGELPPRGGFCDADSDIMVLEDLPLRLTLDTRASAVDHGRPSEGCSVSNGVLVPDFVFSYTPTTAGLFVVQTDLPGTSQFVDSVVYVRDGCDGMGAELACNDDASLTDERSRLSVEVSGAETLYAVVDGFSEGDAGPLEVAFDFISTPSPSGPGGDTCAAATDLLFSGSGDLQVAIAEGDTTGASNDSGCADVATTFDLPDRFYAFTTDEPRDVTIIVEPALYDAAFYVLAACDAPGAVLCHDTTPPGATETTTLSMLPAGRYILGIDAYAHPENPELSAGTYALEVVMSAPQ